MRWFRKPKTVSYPAISQEDDVQDCIQKERIKLLEEAVRRLDTRVLLTEKILGIEVKNIVRDASV